VNSQTDRRDRPPDSGDGSDDEAGQAGDAEPRSDPAASGSAQYAASEQQEIQRQVGEGAVPTCPRCRVAMHRRTIGGGSFGLGYARRREWFLCPGCHRSAIFDAVRGTRN
jgi:hypothetical protein